ncbi:MAG: sugar phosphate isomerase/epimerase family protein [bacterium]
MTTRRQMIKNSALILGGASLSPSMDFLDLMRKRKFKIGACDWSIGKVCDASGLDLAKEIGLDGLQVSLGEVYDNFRLRQPEVQKEFLERSKATGVKISSLGIGELNTHPYKSDPRAEEWVSDSIDVAKNLGVSVVLLAFFYGNDLRNDPAGKAETVRRLKRVAPKAEKMGITLGIESYLTAEEHLEIMQQVGSPAIKVYYDFRNATDAGNDVYKEMKLLGKDNICELHMKENGFLLGKGTLDWQKIGNTLDEIGYYGDGWMQIEYAKPENMGIVESYKHNFSFLRDIFK